MSNVDSAPPAPVGAGGYQRQSLTPQDDRINTLALVAFIGSFFVSLVGIIVGHIALGQIKRSGERGRGFALAGTIIGYVSFVLTAILIAVIIAFVVVRVATSQSAEKAIESQASSSAAYSDEFCYDLFAIAESARQAIQDPSQRQAVTDAYAAVANDPSPHQKNYQAMAALLANPDTATADEIKTITDEMTKVVQTDAIECSRKLQ